MARRILDFIKIKDGKNTAVGASQYWFSQKFAALSGCGPTTASEILAYLAKKNPKVLRSLDDMDFSSPERKSFVRFMGEVREYVKPGVMGLTDIDFYTEQTLAFAKHRGVQLATEQADPNLSSAAAFETVTKVIDAGLPLAMLILTNPFPDIREYTWHWMTIIGYEQTGKQVIIATHGKTHTLDFTHAWVNSGGHKTGIVWFWPEGD